MSDEISPASDTPPALDSSFDLILLDPSKINLFRTTGGTLRVTVSDPVLGGERTYLQVKVARAFPFSKPDSYIGLRDGKDKEIGVLETLTGMDVVSKEHLQEELDRRYFIPRILRVVSIKEERGGLVHFDVETDRGTRQFIVQNPRDSVMDLTSTRILISDKDGIRYEFPDISALDARSAAFFERVT